MKGLCVCTTSPGAQDLARHEGFVCVHNLTRCTRSRQTCMVCVCAQPHQVHKISPDMKGLCVCTTSPGAQYLTRHEGFVCLHNTSIPQDVKLGTNIAVLLYTFSLCNPLPCFHALTITIHDPLLRESSCVFTVSYVQ